MDNLANFLGVFIGFVTIMLLLSMVVTGLAQTASTLFGLRWRGGYKSVVKFLVEEVGLPTDSAKACADKVFRLPSHRKSEGLGDYLKVVWRRLDAARAPRELAWTDLGPPIEAHLKSLAGTNPKQFKPWQEAQAQRLRARISDDYSQRMKTVSFVLAFLVAAGFQVSATKLVHDLSISDEVRNKALELSEKVTEAASTSGAAVAFPTRVERALGEVRQKFPSLEASLEEMSGVSDTRQEAVTELGQVTKQHPEQVKILTAFQASLDQQEEDQAVGVSADSRLAQVSLASLDIRFVENTCFFRETASCRAGKAGIDHFLWANIVGVLMTGVLLTFGAPFWYEKLKTLKVFQNELREAIKAEPREMVVPKQLELEADKDSHPEAAPQTAAVVPIP